jgi:Uma2 family endonuclease
MAGLRIEDLVRMGEAGLVRLEMVRGVGTWEALPTKRHQRSVDQIRATIGPAGEPGDGCGCFHYAAVLIKFSVDTYKRPDIAIFCSDPAEEDEAISMVPAAVIEIISPGYEAKDLDQAPSLYRAFGVQDVLIFDPRSLAVIHYGPAEVRRYVSPVALSLECGCRVTV